MRLQEQVATILYASSPDIAPFRITFETAEGERWELSPMPSWRNNRETKGRPPDEHRFQVKYGSKNKDKSSNLHELWQDPMGSYTTLFVGINTELGFFVGADPVLHSPTLFFISTEFKQSHADRILKEGMDRLGATEAEKAGAYRGTRWRHTFFRFCATIRFEREALGEDQGHRQLIAERATESPAGIHVLAREFQALRE